MSPNADSKPADSGRTTLLSHTPDQFPTSDVRDFKDGPIGWDFQHIHQWTHLNPNWWFIPKANLKLSVPNDYDDDDSDSTTSTSTNKKLLFHPISQISPLALGTGFILDAGTSKIIGCYKNYRDADVHRAHRTATLVSELRYSICDMRREMRVLGVESQTRDAALRKAQRQICKELEERIAAAFKGIRRLNGLLLDARPHSIAVHREAIFEVEGLHVGGGELGLFGRPYAELLEGFERLMGDVFDERVDLPEFVVARRIGLRERIMEGEQATEEERQSTEELHKSVEGGQEPARTSTRRKRPAMVGLEADELPGSKNKRIKRTEETRSGGYLLRKRCK